MPGRLRHDGDRDFESRPLTVPNDRRALRADGGTFRKAQRRSSPWTVLAAVPKE